MGLLSEAIAAHERPAAPPCRLGKLIADSEEQDRAEMDRWLTSYRESLPRSHANYPESPERLARALTAAGYKISRLTVVRHATRGCGCA